MLCLSSVLTNICYIPFVKVRGEEVLTLAQAAAKTGKSANTLRNQIKNGVLVGTLMGKTYLVTESALRDYMEKHAGKVGRPPKERTDA